MCFIAKLYTQICVWEEKGGTHQHSTLDLSLLWKGSSYAEKLVLNELNFLLISYYRTSEAKCAPSSLRSMKILFIDNAQNVVLKRYKDMQVRDCGCQ